MQHWSKSFFFFSSSSFVWTAASPGSVCGTVDWQWQHVFSAGWEVFFFFFFFLRSRLSLHPPWRGESKGGSWKWPCHMGNNSTLRSERTHKRPHYLQQHCRPACEETESRRVSPSSTHLLKPCLYAASDAPFGNIIDIVQWYLRDKRLFYPSLICIIATKLNPLPIVCSPRHLLPTMCA